MNKQVSNNEKTWNHLITVDGNREKERHVFNGDFFRMDAVKIRTKKWNLNDLQKVTDNRQHRATRKKAVMKITEER